MFTDTRLGGLSRHLPGKTKDWNMRVPDPVTKCVVFLGRNEIPGTPSEKWIGTGFFVTVVHAFEAHTYLVTADHVAAELERCAEPFARLIVSPLVVYEKVAD